MPELSFDSWLASVDAYFARRLAGLTTADLPDADYRSMFEEELSPLEALETYAECYDDTGMMMELI